MGRGWGTQAGPGPGTLFAGEQRGGGVREGRAGTKLGVQAPALLLAPQCDHGQVAPCSWSPSPDSAVRTGARWGPGVPAPAPGGVGVLAQRRALRAGNPGPAPEAGKQKPKGKTQPRNCIYAKERGALFFSFKGFKALTKAGGSARAGDFQPGRPCSARGRAGRRAETVTEPGSGSLHGPSPSRNRWAAAAEPPRRVPEWEGARGAADPGGDPDPRHLLADTVTPHAGDSLPAMN